MPEPLRCVPPDSLIAGYDFSTGGVKSLAFDLSGNTVASVRLPTDLWTEGGVTELNVMQIEGQARASTRALVRQLGARAAKLVAIGISATHHTAARIDANHNPVRRAICWNDQTLASFHAVGLARLGGQERARELTGGPWAVRYSLSHLVKDEETLSRTGWMATQFVLPHGPLAAGFLTGRFDCTSVSSAASTGIMDLRTNRWRKEMLEALSHPDHRELAWKQLPRIIAMTEPVGPLADHVAIETGLPASVRPLVFPTLDDQAAGLIGGGAVDAGHVAIILGNSAVVNSSSAELPRVDNLDAMKLNWGPYLWMRCYSNGAQFLDRVAGPVPDWVALETAARLQSPLCNGHSVLPFALSEPSLGVSSPREEWSPSAPSDAGARVRTAFEAIAYLIALGAQAHEKAGQSITRISVSGGIARSDLMLEILASVLNRPLERLLSDEGTALGAAVVALSGIESVLRSAGGISPGYTAADAAMQMVRFRDRVQPRGDWVQAYRTGLAEFERKLG